jgi:ribonuclease VapC
MRCQMSTMGVAQVTKTAVQCRASAAMLFVDAPRLPGGQDVVDQLLRDAKIDVVPVDADLAARAMSGWRRYGKGRHPAGLNFGDCFTYALAEQTGHPVLCTGDSFAATDVTVVGSRRAPRG